MIGHNQIRSFRKFDLSDPMHPDQTQGSHRETPDHIDRETPFPPGNATQCNENKGIEEKQRCNENQPDVQLIT